MLISLAAVLLRSIGRAPKESEASKVIDPNLAQHKSLRYKWVPLFLLLRLSDWLQGPYFYSVYATKLLADGSPYPLALISKLFLMGFASTAVFGPSLGRFADTKGRKRATLLFTLLYSLGAISTKASVLHLLVIGRILSGLGTSLLFSAPESWLVSESQKIDPESPELSKTFGLAYAGDSIVAIAAGQMATMAARLRGETGPFELSASVLVIAAMGVASVWRENSAQLSSGASDNNGGIREAIKVVAADKKIMLVGLMQALFEASMYIFVLQWPPSVSAAISTAFPGSATPYGSVFSCFMASCLVGSTVFGKLIKFMKIEKIAAAMMIVASISMTVGTWAATRAKPCLWLLMGAFFVFESTVGCYFPTIGTLRSKYIPDANRSVIMNLFGIPLNALVVGVFLSINMLGVGGALSVSSGALMLATVASVVLPRFIEAIEESSTISEEVETTTDVAAA